MCKSSASKVTSRERFVRICHGPSSRATAHILRDGQLRKMGYPHLKNCFLGREGSFRFLAWDLIPRLMRRSSPHPLSAVGYAGRAGVIF